MRNWRVLLSIVTLACVGACQERSLPRPAGLPEWVPQEATIKRWPGHGEGGLLLIEWGHQSLTWAEPCRSLETADAFAYGGERKAGCPAQLDMKIRPMYLGTLDWEATQKAQEEGSSKSCCYSFQTLGNR